jgi:hypothetical protein
MGSRRLKNLAFEGFGVGIGFLAALAIYVLLGMIFFIPGFILVANERKKVEKNTALQGLGIALMILGVIIMGGAGIGVVMDSIGDILS